MRLGLKPSAVMFNKLKKDYKRKTDRKYVLQKFWAINISDSFTRDVWR